MPGINGGRGGFPPAHNYEVVIVRYNKVYLFSLCKYRHSFPKVEGKSLIIKIILDTLFTYDIKAFVMAVFIS